MIEISLVGDFAVRHLQILTRKLRVPARFTSLAKTASKQDVRAGLQNAEIVVTDAWTAELGAAPKLKFLQVCSTGIDRIDRSAIPGGVTVSNVFGHEDAVGEYVVMGMMAFSHQLLRQLILFRKHKWTTSGYAAGEPHDEFAGKRVVIVGFGRIGRSIATKAAALGGRVIAVNRSPVADRTHVERSYAFNDIDEALADCDYLVICCAATPETVGLIDARRLALLPKQAVVINVARGPIIVEADLFETLRANRIGGAIIDAWYRYPPPQSIDGFAPSAFPFETLDNVIMTPHSSAWTHGAIERRWTAIATNIEKFAAGHDPDHLLFRT